VDATDRGKEKQPRERSNRYKFGSKSQQGCTRPSVFEEVIRHLNEDVDPGGRRRDKAGIFNLGISSLQTDTI
jgi:hypothetical protein